MIYDKKPAPKMKIYVETALRNVFEGTKLVFGIFFQESSTCYTNQTFEIPLDITISSFEPKREILI